MAASFKWQKVKYVVLIVIIVYILASIYTAYVLFSQHFLISSTEVAIGLYLWEHVLEGPLKRADDVLVQTGNLTVNKVEFRFYTGPGVVQGLVSSDVECLVLVVNGRDQEKVAFARTWLDYLHHLPRLKWVAVAMLGNERCENGWILQYMTFRGGPVHAVFLVYDSHLVDGRYFYQWPLGVATYRRFPRLQLDHVDIRSRRSHLCNFVATVYPNSSREAVVRILKSTASADCVVSPRYTWQPSETDDSLQTYVATLLNSELTLSPVGVNTECYRIYEAMACGSVPVVEDVATPGECVGTDGGPLRLLKKHGAPIVLVKKWERDLPAVLSRQRSLSEPQKVAQRRNVVLWYRGFLKTMKSQFVQVVETRLNASEK